ncbi:MAG: MaoC family dehydratase [Caulobacterales bacterium]|jgi:3-hydroxybutyryl-CoA dehydratase
MAQTGLFFEDLSLGQSASLSRMVNEADVVAFAQVSGDDNPVHLDAAFAATTPFKERIAHGMLSASYISALLGTKLPGPGAIYLSQTLSFKRPVKLGATVEATVTITALDSEKGRVTLACVCKVEGKPVLEGEAVVMAPKRVIEARS